MLLLWTTNPHGRGRLLRLRHLPILGKETIIEIIPRRGRCPYCKGGPTTTQRLDWYDTNSKCTRPYEQHLLFELINSTVADISLKKGYRDFVTIVSYRCNNEVRLLSDYKNLKLAIAVLRKQKDYFTDDEKSSVEKQML